MCGLAYSTAVGNDTPGFPYSTAVGNDTPGFPYSTAVGNETLGAATAAAAGAAVATAVRAMPPSRAALASDPKITLLTRRIWTTPYLTKIAYFPKLINQAN
jgi:hypothetical protein